MTTSPVAGPASRSRISAVLYYAVMTVLFPLTLLGYVLWLGGATLNARRTGVSMTAQAPLAVRWTMHFLGLRDDPVAARVFVIVPGIPRSARAIISIPMLLAFRVSRYVPRTYRYPFEGDVPRQLEAAARVTFFDDVLERFLPAIDQLVVLGAGFDTRPYRPPADSGVESYELDQPRTQAVKLGLLRQAGVDLGHVHFVPADFQTDDWLDALVGSGFDVHRSAVFLWEGVTQYLTRVAVEDTLRKVSRCASGTVIAFDYFTTEALTSADLYWRFGRSSAAAAGEPLGFGVAADPPVRERTAELLSACGLSLLEQRTLGADTAADRAWGGFAVAVVP